MWVLLKYMYVNIEPISLVILIQAEEIYQNLVFSTRFDSSISNRTHKKCIFISQNVKNELADE